MVPPDSHKISRVPWYSGAQSASLQHVAYRALTVYGRLFQNRSTISEISYLPRQIRLPVNQVPLHQMRNALTLSHASGLGCSQFARRYYGNRGCFLFLGLLRCFSSPSPLPDAIYSHLDCQVLTQQSCLIRVPPDQSLFAAPRSVSSLATPFIGSLPQGIHHSLYVA